MPCAPIKGRLDEEAGHYSKFDMQRALCAWNARAPNRFRPATKRLILLDTTPADVRDLISPTNPRETSDHPAHLALNLAKHIGVNFKAIFVML